MQSKEGATILELSHNKIEEHLPRPLSVRGPQKKFFISKTLGAHL